MRGLKCWLAPFIRDCLLMDEKNRSATRVRTCLACAHSNAVDARFCSSCGQPLQFPAIRPPQGHEPVKHTDLRPVIIVRTGPRLAPPMHTDHRPAMPVNTGRRPASPVKQETVSGAPIADAPLRPFLGYVRSHRPATGPSGSFALAHRAVQVSGR